MRIGIVSDTHNNLRNVREIVALFNDAGVEQVIHTGDITQAKTLDAFAGLCVPMCGVYGNNDQGELDELNRAVAANGFDFVQPPLRLDWFNRHIVVVHDPLELVPLNLSDADIVLHGHTHRLTITHEEHRLTFNPGECAGMMKGKNAIGVLDLSDVTPSLLHF